MTGFMYYNGTTKKMDQHGEGYRIKMNNDMKEIKAFLRLFL